jgi:glutathione synthase/RimK-type ligase-like ATP-grasp enzyme
MARLRKASDLTLVTCDAQLGLSADDRLLRAALEEHGLSVAVASWSDTEFDWSNTRIAVVRSAWDSHLRPQQFIQWVSAVSALTTLCNSAEAIRWNFDKHYLIDLRDAGVASIPTIHVAPDSIASFQTHEIPWDMAVVKPLVGANSHEVRSFEVSSEISALNAHLHSLRRTGALVQRLQPTVRTLSERSLVFIAGQFSHAVRRIPFNTGNTPDSPDFDHKATPEEVAFALGALAAAQAPESPFARVDLLPTADGILLMELELIDPSLFLTRNPSAAQKLASCLVRRLDRLE